MLTNKLTGVGAAEKTYVEDVFSTYLYTGNGATQTINNGINIGDLSALLHLAGDTLTDSAPVPNTITNYNVSVNTTTKKYGTGSLYFNGSAKLLTASNASIPIAANEDFTVEAWVYPTSVSPTFLNCVATPRVSSGDWYFGFYTGKLFFYDDTVSTFFGNGTITLNTWQHIAYTRQGTTHRLFLNGVLTDTLVAGARAYTSQVISVGSDNSSNSTPVDPFSGYLDDFRVVKGKALYTSTFTPPTTALPTGVLEAGKGGMVWIKERSANGFQHQLCNSERGWQYSLKSDATTGESDNSIVGGITSANNNGFSLGSYSRFNYSAATYTSWTFRKAPKFFDVLTWTGTGAAREISHSLGQAPGMIIVKRTDTTGAWYVYHRSLTTIQYLVLNTTAAAATGSGRNPWDIALPTSTAFSLSTDANVNALGGTYVAYLFAHDTTADGMIQCGSFTTNASGNATVNLGWEPQYVMLKASGLSQNWFIYDTMRGFSQQNIAEIKPNASNSETNTSGNYVFPTATGFGINNSWFSASSTYIYMAIRRPMKTPTDGTKVFQSIVRTGSGTASVVNTTITPDVVFIKNRGASGTDNKWVARLTDNYYLQSTLTSAETQYAPGLPAQMWDNQTGFDVAGTWDQVNSSSYSYINYAFKRAPGFFDVVCTSYFVGGTPVNHNLGVAPELIFAKARSDSTGNWMGGCNINGASYSHALNSTSAFYNNGVSASSVYTATTVDPGGINNALGGGVNGTASPTVLYLFASCPGVSKVGTFTGTGSAINVDCGFTNGARFVLIKRTNGTGNWLVYDSARGIVDANDPVLALNSTGAEQATVDGIDPYSAGFTINSVLAGSGQTFIYLAIA